MDALDAVLSIQYIPIKRMNTIQFVHKNLSVEIEKFLHKN